MEEELTDEGFSSYFNLPRSARERTPVEEKVFKRRRLESQLNCTTSIPSSSKSPAKTSKTSVIDIIVDSRQTTPITQLIKLSSGSPIKPHISNFSSQNPTLIGTIRKEHELIDLISSSEDEADYEDPSSSNPQPPDPEPSLPIFPNSNLNEEVPVSDCRQQIFIRKSKDIFEDDLEDEINSDNTLDNNVTVNKTNNNTQTSSLEKCVNNDNKAGNDNETENIVNISGHVNNSQNSTCIADVNLENLINDCNHDVNNDSVSKNTEDAVNNDKLNHGVLIPPKIEEPVESGSQLEIAAELNSIASAAATSSVEDDYFNPSQSTSSEPSLTINRNNDNNLDGEIEPAISSTTTSASLSTNKNKSSNLEFSEAERRASLKGNPKFKYPVKTRKYMYKCVKCPSTFQSTYKLFLHKKHHGQKAGYKCPHCDFSRDGRRFVDEHSLCHTPSSGSIDFGHKRASPIISKTPPISPTKRVLEPSSSCPSPLKKSKIVTPVKINSRNGTYSIESEVMSEKEVARMGNPLIVYPPYFSKHSRLNVINCYKCKNCPYVTDHYKQYLVHSQRHSKKCFVTNGVFKCEMCSYNGSNAGKKPHLKSHKLSELIAKKGVDNMGWEVEYIDNVKRFINPNYGQSSNSNSFNRTQVRSSPLRENKAKSYGIQKKNMHVKNLNMASQHHLTITKIQKSCDECGFTTNTQVLMEMHKKSHSLPSSPGSKSIKNSPSSPSIKQFSNEEREKLIAGNPNFIYKKWYSYTRAGKKITCSSYKCFKCPYSERRIEKYVAHAKYHGANHLLNCQQCDFSTNNAPHFKNHAALHDMQKKSNKNNNTVVKQDSSDYSSKTSNPICLGKNLSRQLFSNSSADTKRKCGVAKKTTKNFSLYPGGVLQQNCSSSAASNSNPSSSTLTAPVIATEIKHSSENGILSTESSSSSLIDIRDLIQKIKLSHLGSSDRLNREFEFNEKITKLTGEGTSNSQGKSSFIFELMLALGYDLFLEKIDPYTTICGLNLFVHLGQPSETMKTELTLSLDKFPALSKDFGKDLVLTRLISLQNSTVSCSFEVRSANEAYKKTKNLKNVEEIKEFFSGLKMEWVESRLVLLNLENISYLLDRPDIWYIYYQKAYHFHKADLMAELSEIQFDIERTSGIMTWKMMEVDFFIKQLSIYKEQEDGDFARPYVKHKNSDTKACEKAKKEYEDTKKDWENFRMMATSCEKKIEDLRTHLVKRLTDTFNEFLLNKDHSGDIYIDDDKKMLGIGLLRQIGPSSSKNLQSMNDSCTWRGLSYGKKQLGIIGLYLGLWEICGHLPIFIADSYSSTETDFKLPSPTFPFFKSFIKRKSEEGHQFVVSMPFEDI